MWHPCFQFCRLLDYYRISRVDIRPVVSTLCPNLVDVQSWICRPRGLSTSGLSTPRLEILHSTTEGSIHTLLPIGLRYSKDYQRQHRSANELTVIIYCYCCLTSLSKLNDYQIHVLTWFKQSLWLISKLGFISPVRHSGIWSWTIKISFDY